jgi:probable HAF family extracellular repeat protein
MEPAALIAHDSGSSPHGKYVLTAVANPGSIQVTIDQVSPAARILSIAIPEGSNWGFSPDDDRFSYHYLTGSIETVRLFDLTSTSPDTWVWEGSSNPVASETVFSPNGVYLMYVAIDATPQTFLKLVDARTGDVRYQAQPLAYTTPADPGDISALQGWGFSPDADDRSFLYGTVLGPQWIDFNVVNLAAAARVHNESILGIAAFWQFSPCGDALVLVTQDNPTQATTVLRRTSDGVQIGGRVDPFLAVVDTNSAIAFSTTASQHVATVGANAYDLAANVAGVACPSSPPLQSVSVAPASVTGGSASICTVTLSAPAAAGGAVVSMTYTPGGNVSGVASVRIPAGHASASFGITTGVVTSSTEVTVLATLDLVSKQATLTILPAPPELDTFVLWNNDVLGGEPVNADVRLTAGAPPEGATVVLTSSNPLAATLPPSVVLAPNHFAEGLVVTSLVVDAADSTDLTASYRGRVRTQKLVVRPVTLKSLRLSMHCVVGGDSLYAEALLDGPAGARGAHVALASDQASVTLPDTCVIPPGASFAEFGVATHPVVAQVVVHLTASLRGVTVGDSLTVFDQMDVVVRDLGTLEGFFDNRPNQGYYGFSSDGQGLNNLGQVIGSSSSAELMYGAPFRWSAGSMTDLKFLPGDTTTAFVHAINDAGVVVGETNQVGCIFESGTVTDIPLVDGPANDINQAGHIVGGTMYPLREAWFYDGSATMLGMLPGGMWSMAQALNDSDVVVGTVQDSQYVHHPFRWTAATGMVALPVPADATDCYALDITNAGAIVGYCHIGASDQAIAWQDTVMTRLEGPGTRFLAANNIGLTLGTVNWQPTIWNGATPFLIQSALVDNCGVRLGAASALNDVGQIAGTDDTAGHAVLLTSTSTAPWMQSLTAAEASGTVVTAEPTRVTLLWETREIVLAGTHVERSEAGGGWELVGTPRVSGGSQLAFVDEGLAPGTEYAYRLAVLDGAVTRYVGMVGVRTPKQLSLAIQGFRPNPARAGDVSIFFSLPVAGDATIEVFDVNGRRRANHVARGLAAGVQQARLPEAKSLAQGVYFVRLSQAGRSSISRLAIAR